MESQRQIPIKIRMFGRFSIAYDGYEISPEHIRSRQLWTLLEYLIVNRRNEMPVEKLADVLWPEHEVDNIQGALKNLVYRLRNMLSAVGRTPEREYILFTRGNYSWNNDLPCEIDSEQFAQLHRLTMAHDATAQQIEKNGMAAIELFKGDFLSANVYEEWAIPMSTYYHNLFFDCVFKVCDVLFDQQRFEDVDRVCAHAIAIDPFEEQVHIIKMRVLVRLSKNQDALSHYDYVTALFYKELGVRPSEELTDIYKELAKQMNSVENDILIVRDKIEADTKDINGAFYCDYEIFKKIYTFQQRSVERNGQSVFVGLMSVGEQGKPMISDAKRERAMEALNTALYQSLRKGDIFSRFSATQYIVMLPSVSFENSDIVIKRISSKFKNSIGLKNVEITAKVTPIEPTVRLSCDLPAI